MNINPSVLLLLAIIAPVAIGLWLYKHLRRTVAVLFAVAAFLLVVGFATWRDSLASLVTSERALAGLLAVFGVSGLILGIHIHSARKPRGGQQHKDHHHHVWTPALAVVSGTSLALIVGEGINLLRQLQHAPAGTSGALSQAVTQINSGQAGHALPHGQGMTVVAIGGGILAVLIAAAHRYHSPRKPKARKPAAIGGGTPAGNSPARRGISS